MSDKPRTGNLIVGAKPSIGLPRGIELEPVLDLLEKGWGVIAEHDWSKSASEEDKNAIEALLREHGRLK